MLQFKSRIALAGCRFKYTWWAWLLILILLIVWVANIDSYDSLMLIMYVVGWFALMVIMMVYMWYIENKLQDKLNTIRKQYGLKEICGKESFWKYSVRF